MDWIWVLKEKEETRMTLRLLAWRTHKVGIPFTGIGKTIGRACLGCIFKVGFCTYLSVYCTFKYSCQISNLAYEVGVKGIVQDGAVCK